MDPEDENSERLWNIVEHSFIPLAHAECNDSLQFSGASSIPLCYVPYYFIHSIGMCRMRWFLAVLRSFFHSSLLCTFSCHPSLPTILPSSLTSSCRLFHGLPLNRFVPKFPSFWGSFKKLITVYFYLAWGLAHCKTLNLMGQNFWSGFTPLYDLLLPQLPEHHLPLVWFWSVLLLGGLQPSIGDYSLFQLTSHPRRLELILIIVGTACHCLICR